MMIKILWWQVPPWKSKAKAASQNHYGGTLPLGSWSQGSVILILTSAAFLTLSDLRLFRYFSSAHPLDICI